MHASKMSLLISMLLLPSSCAIDSLAANAMPGSAVVLANRGDDLAGKTVVITGASSGFGKGVALELARRGANLVLASRRKDALEQVASQCNGRAITVTTDVSEQKDVDNLCKTAVEKFGHIDVWINDAGVGAIGRFLDVPPGDQSKIVQTDLTGVIFGSYCALKQFEMQKYGTLINVSSVVGVIPLAYYASYSAAKCGVTGLDKALQAELKADKVKGIHVCTVYPAAADTPFWTHAANYSKHTTQPPYLERPDPVVKAIAKLVTKPKDDVFVGTFAKLAHKSHQMTPGLVENVSAKTIRRTQIETSAPEQSGTDGSVLTPTGEAGATTGGVAERMKQEKETTPAATH